MSVSASVCVREYACVCVRAGQTVAQTCSAQCIHQGGHEAMLHGCFISKLRFA